MELNKITLEHKYELKKNIEQLDKNELLEIFKIIRSDTKKYTENNNGIFINLKHLKKKTLKKIFNFVNYCKNNILITNKIQEKISINKEIREDYSIEKMNEEFTAYQYNLDNEDLDNIDQIIVYPKLNNKKPKLNGVAARILKQCKEINKSNTEYIMISKKSKKSKNVEKINFKDNLDLQIDIDEMYSIITTDDDNDQEEFNEMSIGY